MKLVSRYNRINIIATIIVLLVASIFYFFILRYVLIHQLDNTLKVEEAEISNYVKVHDQLPEATDYRDQHTHFEEVSQPVSRQFNNIRLRGEHGHEMRSYRELSFPIAIHEQHFKASV